jgi:hypothetical protein
MTVGAVGSAELPNERCEFRLQLTCPWHQPRAVRRLVSGDDPIRAYLAGGRLAPDGYRSGAPPKSGSQKTRRWRGQSTANSSRKRQFPDSSELGSDFDGVLDDSGNVKTLFRARIRQKCTSFPWRVAPRSGVKPLLSCAFSRMGIERADEFTVYKRSRLDHTTPKSSQNLIFFRHLRTQSASSNLP